MRQCVPKCQQCRPTATTSFGGTRQPSWTCTRRSGCIRWPVARSTTSWWSIRRTCWVRRRRGQRVRQMTQKSRASVKRTQCFRRSSKVKRRIKRRKRSPSTTMVSCWWTLPSWPFSRAILIYRLHPRTSVWYSLSLTLRTSNNREYGRMRRDQQHFLRTCVCQVWHRILDCQFSLDSSTNQNTTCHTTKRAATRPKT